MKNFHNINESVFISNDHLVSLALVSLGIYIIASAINLKKYTSVVKNFYSDISKMNLLFLKTIMIFAIMFTSIILIIKFMLALKIDHHQFIPPGTLYITFMLGTFTVTFFTIRYPELFRPAVIQKTPRYEKHQIDEIKEKEYITKLLTHMKEEKPYLNDSITLQDLSESLSISGHHLSMILNRTLGQNFYIFINAYRVEEVKRRLHDPEYADYNILNIAFHTGFNSKSTFNSIFKKITGITPTEYRNAKPE